MKKIFTIEVFVMLIFLLCCMFQPSFSESHYYDGGGLFAGRVTLSYEDAISSNWSLWTGVAFAKGSQLGITPYYGDFYSAELLFEPRLYIRPNSYRGWFVGGLAGVGVMSLPILTNTVYDNSPHFTARTGLEFGYKLTHSYHGLGSTEIWMGLESTISLSYAYLMDATGGHSTFWYRIGIDFFMQIPERTFVTRVKKTKTVIATIDTNTNITNVKSTNTDSITNITSLSNTDSMTNTLQSTNTSITNINKSESTQTNIAPKKSGSKDSK